MKWTATPPNNPHTGNWIIRGLDGDPVAEMRGGLVEQERNARLIVDMVSLAAVDAVSAEGALSNG